MNSVKLSIVVAVSDPWPAAKICVESLEQQTDLSNIEVIFADGSGCGIPEEKISPGIVKVVEKGAPVSKLRSLGVIRSRGEIIAFTEDHCRVAPDWCAQMIALHEAYPDAAAIGGIVENGATGSILDEVHFLIANGPYMRPLRHSEKRVLTGQANVSFKRRFLADGIPASGIVQMFFNRDLIQRGLHVMMSDRLEVWHVQSLGVIGTCRMHFHTGRTIAGFRRNRISRVHGLMRTLSCLILPLYLAGRTLHTVFSKRRKRREAIVGLPITGLLVTCHAAGEFTGYIAGAGSSPYLVR